MICTVPKRSDRYRRSYISDISPTRASASASASLTLSFRSSWRCNDINDCTIDISFLMRWCTSRMRRSRSSSNPRSRAVCSSTIRDNSLISSRERSDIHDAIRRVNTNITPPRTTAIPTRIPIARSVSRNSERSVRSTRMRQLQPTSNE